MPLPFTNRLMTSLTAQPSIQDFSQAIQEFPENIQSILVKAKMQNDALLAEISIINSKIAKAKLEASAIEKEILLTKQAKDDAIKKENTPSPAFNGVMALLKSKYK